MVEETNNVAPTETAQKNQDQQPEAAVDSKEESTLLGGQEEQKEETTDSKTSDKKEESKEEQKPVVPEKYDIKVPDGMTLDKDMLDKLSPIFKESGLSNDAVQKLADAYAPFISNAVEAERKTSLDTFKAMVDEWKTETIKELGADYNKELAVASKFIDRFGTPRLREILNETGLGNNLEVVKIFVRAGKMISEDSFPDSSKKGDQVETEDQKAKKLFPTMQK